MFECSRASINLLFQCFKIPKKHIDCWKSTLLKKHTAIYNIDLCTASRKQHALIWAGHLTQPSFLGRLVVRWWKYCAVIGQVGGVLPDDWLLGDWEGVPCVYSIRVLNTVHFTKHCTASNSMLQRPQQQLQSGSFDEPSPVLSCFWPQYSNLLVVDLVSGQWNWQQSDILNIVQSLLYYIYNSYQILI